MRLLKAIVTLLKEDLIRAVRGRARNQDAVPVKTLDGMSQGGTVMLLKNVGANLNNAVRTQADELTIEGTVVKGAKGQAIRNARLA